MKGGQQFSSGPYGPGQGTPGAPSAPASGGKGGGGYGGSQMEDGPGMIGQTRPSAYDNYLPDSSGYFNENPAGSTSQNGFEQGLGAMNQGMNWFGNAMNHQAPQLSGNYGSGGLDVEGILGQLGSAGGGGYRAAMAQAPGQELYDYNPALAQGQSYGAAQLRDQDINQYMNPYTDNVINSTMNDLDRSRQQALNSTGAAATSGGAFGGDRHGIMEAQNNRDYMDSVARTSGQLRNQAYMNAQNAAMGDVSSLNQQRASNAGMAQQAGLANQAAQNARSQFVGGTANSNAMQTALANQGAQNQASAIGAQNAAQASIANASSKNSLLGQLAGLQQNNNQFNAGMDFSRDQFNANQAQQQFANQASAANTLYGMGNDRYNMTDQALGNMGQLGQYVDGINNQYLQQGMNMFDQNANWAQNQFQYALGPLGSMQGGQTQTYNPGKMDYLQMGAGLGGAALMGSDAGLKDNLKPIAKINGFQLYKWTWNERAREVGCDNDPTFGVVAQEVQELRPEAVVEHPDGYLMVDYGKLPEIARTVAMGGQ